MATTLEIANQALLRCGAEKIEALSDTDERAIAVNDSWDFVRREVLRSHSWNIATTRALLTAYAPEPVFDYVSSYALPSDCLRVLEVQPDAGEDSWRVEGDKIVTDRSPSPALETEQALTFAPSAASPVVVSLTSHGYSDGDVVKMIGTGMTEVNDRFFRVAGATTSTFELENEDGTGRTVAAIAGTAARVSAGDLKVRYIKDLTAGTDGTFDAALESLLALRLAVEVVERITDSTTKKQALEAEYTALFRQARGDDGEEQSNSEFEESTWITSRY